MRMFRQLSSKNFDNNADIKLQEVIRLELAKGNITLSG